MMKTKALALAIALLACAKGTAPAQVYSVNIVGYINLTLNPGLNLIVNQLAATDDDIGSFIPSAPDGTVVFRFDPVTQSYRDGLTFVDGFGWYSAPSQTNDSTQQVLDGTAWYPRPGPTNYSARSIPVGEGFFIHVPSSAGMTLTFVGEVVLDSTNPIPGNFSLKGSVIPQAGRLAGDLLFPPADGDSVYQWDSVLQQFKSPSVFASSNSVWQPDEPVVVVGEGFGVFRKPALATPDRWWIRHFSVGPPAPPPRLVAASAAPAPAIRRLALPPGKVTLDVSNPSGAAYDVQYSPYGVVWSTLATGQIGDQWSASFTGGNGGYFRLRQSSY